MIHDLQQNVEDVRVGLLDLVEQEHTVRMLIDPVGQQAALVESDIARRGPDQARDGVLFHVFGHVEAQEFHPSVSASWRATSVLPTPVGPAKR